MRFSGVSAQLMLCISIWPFDRAQYDVRLLPPSGCGALRLDPVSLLYLARPFAVRPAPFDAGSFSPRPIDKLTDFFLAIRAAPRS
jgi:hypothetical protein